MVLFLPDSVTKTTALQKLSDTSMCIKIIYISVQGKSIGNIQNYELSAWRGVLDYIEISWQKQEKNDDNWSSTSMYFGSFCFWSVAFFFVFDVKFLFLFQFSKCQENNIFQSPILSILQINKVIFSSDVWTDWCSTCSSS